MATPNGSDFPLHHDSLSSPVMQLPTETLLDVFFWASRIRYYVVDSVEEENKFTAPIAQSLVSVCRRWLEVLAMNPLYWENFKIIIDSPTFSVDIITTFLSMVASLDKIEIVVALSSANSRTLVASQEGERLSAVVQLLPPYFERLLSLSINSAYRSSIVHASRFLDGAVLPKLAYLVLVSQETDDTSSLEMSSFECPSISLLAIDAKSFVDLSNCVISWPTVPDRFDLRITKYRPDTPFLALDARSVVDALKALDDVNPFDLDIDNVEVDADDDDDDYQTYPHIEQLMWLGLNALQGSLVSSLCNAIRSPYLDTVDVEGCEPSSRSPMPGQELHLTGIRSSCTILRMIQDWEGCALIVKDCPGFDDWLLGALAYCNKDEDGLACPYMSRIEILGGCTAFSASAFQRMCEMRHDVARIGDVDIKDAPVLDGGLRTWFEEHMDSFFWAERAV